MSVISRSAGRRPDPFLPSPVYLSPASVDEIRELPLYIHYGTAIVINLRCACGAEGPQTPSMTASTHEPRAAALHRCTRRDLHPDCEEAVKIERQRVTQELRSYKHEASLENASHSHNIYNGSLSPTRQSSHKSSTASNVPLQTRESLQSYATTQSDPSYSRDSSVREQHWYRPIVKFWTTHVRYIP